MVIHYIKVKADRLIAFTERVSEKKYWELRLLVFALIISFFTAFPSYDLFIKNWDYNTHHWKGITHQINQPFSLQKYESISHESNISFRITVPLFANLLGFGNQPISVQIFLLFALQILCLGLLLFTLSKLFYRLSKDKACSAFLVICFSLTYPGNSLPLDIWGCLDIVAYCLLACSLLSNKPYLTLLFSLMAAFTDERALIASSLVFLFHFWKTSEFSINKREPYLKLNSFSYAILLSWLMYFTIRISLGAIHGLETNTDTLSKIPVVIKEAVGLVPMGIWSALEGMWLIVLLGITVLIVQKKWIPFFLLISAMFIITVTAFSILDITRSMAYIYPVVCISVLILSKTESIKNLRYLYLLAATICLFPTYFAGGQNTIKWLYPFPLQILRMITNSETFSVTF